jgi:hypothetical protein
MGSTSYSLRASEMRWVLYSGRGPGRTPIARILCNLDPEGTAQDLRVLSMEGAPLTYRSADQVAGVSAAIHALMQGRLVHHVEVLPDGNVAVEVDVEGNA